LSTYLFSFVYFTYLFIYSPPEVSAATQPWSMWSKIHWMLQVLIGGLYGPIIICTHMSADTPCIHSVCLYMFMYGFFSWASSMQLWEQVCIY